MQIDIPTRVGFGGIFMGVCTAVLLAVVPHPSPYIWVPLLVVSAAAALWGFVPVFRHLFPALEPDTPKVPMSDLRNSRAAAEPFKSVRRKASLVPGGVVYQDTRPVERDAWLQDAVAFALYGHWPTQDEKIFDQEGDLDKLGTIVQAMRQSAADGRLSIWGRSHELGVLEHIEPEFWLHNQIDYLRLFGPADGVRTEQTVGRVNEYAVYKSLMVSHVQVERQFS
ncbi:MAG TPA: hypothetical protein VG821_03725 [Rhizomicrobium sp.]|nr:hypothetical protein [Rhizomicrobium sp.]